MAFGYSRDDIGTFLPDYLAQGVLPVDPFASLDTTGVGQLVETACVKDSTRGDLKLGICGEHGGDAPSIFSAMPSAWTTYLLSVPRAVVVLAAGQAAIAEKQG